MKKYIARVLCSICLCSSLYGKVHVVNNPLVDSFLTVLRDKTTNGEVFQETTKKLTNCLVFETARFLDFEKRAVDTPCGQFNNGIALKKNPILVSVYRAGLSLLDAYRNYFVGAPCGFLGVKRNEKSENAEPQMYYSNLPEISRDDKVIILETMLATGGSAGMVVAEILKNPKISPSNIIIVSVICATEGVKRLEREFPGITIVTAALDKILNDKKYIVPGLGDFGDRFFGNDSEPDFQEM